MLAGCAAHAPPDRTLNPEIQAALLEQSSAARQKQGELDSVQTALLPPLQQPLRADVAKDLEPRFDLSVNNASAQQVFLSIASGTRYSMVVHPEVTGNISVSLKDVTVIEAMQAIREIFGYDYKIDGSRIYVLPVTIQTRVFRVNYLIGQRQARSDIRVSSGSVADAPLAPTPGAPGAPVTPVAVPGGAAAVGVTDSSRIQTSTKSDFWDELAKTLQTVIGTAPGRSVVVNSQAGVVVVRALPVEIRQVEQYLNAIRDSVQRQVMLEAKIIEVTLNDEFQAGINWALFSSSGRTAAGLINPGASIGVQGAQATGQLSINSAPGSGSLTSSASGSLIPGVPGGALFGLAFQTQNFAGLLQFLESQGSVQVLSSPRIATINNQSAVLKVGTDEFFVTNVAAATTTVTSVAGTAAPQFPSVTLRPFFSGVALDITPQIDEDSTITLHIHPSVSRVVQDNRQLNLGSFGGSVTLPLAKSDVSETDSVVRAADGNIVAIGGLMKVDISDTRSGLPGLQDSQSFGGVFGSRAKTMVKKELVILIKPTVVQTDRDVSEDLRAVRERLLGTGRSAN